MKKRLGKFLTSTALVGALLVSTGCSDSDDPEITILPLPPGNSEIRVIHASPDAPAVNVLLNGAEAISALDYGQSSGYAEVTSGAYDIVVQGIIPGGTADVISVPAFDLADDARTNVLAINAVATIDALVVEESAATPTATQVALAVVHAAPDAPEVDIFVSAPGDDITTLTPVTTLSFTQSADAGALDTGTVQIRATAAGTVVYDSGSVDLTPFGGAKLFISAIASTTATEQAASPIKLLVATDSDAITLLDTNTGAGAKVVHASADAGSAAGGPVEVFATSMALGADPVELIPSFAYTESFPDAATYAAVPAADYIFDVAPDTDMIGDSVFTSGSLTLETAGEYTVIAAGRVTGTPAFDLLVTQDSNRAIVTEARVKVIHAAPAAGTVDVFVTPAGSFTVDQVESGAAGDPLLDDFVYPTITDYVAVEPGDYDIRVVAGGSVAINVEGFTLGAGLVANVIARGPAEPSGAPTDFGLIVTTN
ncbi:MAG: DUF4397 domain-containing protein [Gammaproteobacteria bacterium]